MRIINVFEMVGGAFCGSLESFPIWEEQLSDDVIEVAQKLFSDKAMENGAEEDDIESYLEDGHYENSDYEVFLVWSNVNE